MTGFGQTMAQRGAAMLALLLAAACGGESEDFAIEVARPVQIAIAPFGPPNLSEGRGLFPGLEVARSKPDDTEVLYTIPADAGKSSTIRLRFEPLEASGKTMVHATVSVPPTRAVIDGTLKVLSEAKIERALRSLLDSTAAELAMGSDRPSSARKLDALLLAVAVATRKDYLTRALALKDNPELRDIAMASFDFGSDDGIPDGALDDPERAARRDSDAHAMAEYRDRLSADEASRPIEDARPMDDTQGSE